jgi:outer membrane immunogenic protein
VNKFNRLMLACFAAAGFCGLSARANADTYTGSSTYNWSGFYAGVHAGLGSGNTNWSDTPATSANIDAAGLGEKANTDMSGAFAGGQFGYNWQFKNNWVAGVEGSVSGSNIIGTSADQFNPGWTLRDRVAWVGTATARIGYAVNRVLLYGRGGLAVDGNSFGIENVGTNLGSPGSTGLGWTAGAGVEWAIAPKLSMFVESDYYDLGGQTAYFAGNMYGPGANAPFSTKISQTIETLDFGVNYRF